MVSIIIDTMDLSAEFNLSKGDVDNLMEFTVKEITAAFARSWEDTARNGLSQTRRQYINAIVVGEEGRFTGYAMLHPSSWIANAVEYGASAFDIKDGILASSKSKPTADGSGRYMSIPFRMATPGSLGESEAFSGVVPEPVFKAIGASEKLAAEEGRSPALRVEDLPSPYDIPKTRAQVISKSKSFEAYQHKSSIYVGLKRKQDGGGLVNFRRISTNSDPMSWIHPGIEARNFAEITLANFESQIPHEVDMAIDGFLSQILGL